MHYRRIDEITGRLRLLDKVLFYDRRSLECRVRIESNYLPSAPTDTAGFRPICPGTAWGRDGIAYIRCDARIPNDYDGARVVVLPRIGGSALLYVNEVPFHGVDPWHPFVVLADRARRGERLRLLLEAVPHADWSTPGSGIFSGIDLARVNVELWDFWHDAMALFDTARVLPTDRPRQRTSWQQLELKSAGNSRPYDDNERAEQILHALERALNRMSWSCIRQVGRGPRYYYAQTPVDTEPQCTVEAALQLGHEARKARRDIAPFLAHHGAEGRLTLWQVPNSHLDVMWLWPLEESRRKMARTTATVLRQLDLYPDGRFVQSQACLYDMLREGYPSLYARVKEAVRGKRWEIVGGMWVESDTNIPSGESLVRQILFGKRFFRHEFGVDVRVAWLPDVFGLSGALPQILAKSGMPYGFSAKLVTNEDTRFPQTLSRWAGIDGSRVVLQTPLSYYNDDNGPEMMLDYSNFFREKGIHDSMLFLYGVGDGGGGPTVRQIEQARRLKDQPGLPRLESKPVRQFFDRAARNVHLAAWRGEIYQGAHRGTYTTMARLKRLNRLAELRMRELEMLSAMAGPQTRETAWRVRAWKTILLHQFHDVVTGTSIDSCHAEAIAELEDVIDRTACRRDRLLVRWAGGGRGESRAFVFNPLSWSRRELVVLPASFARSAQRIGNAQRTKDDTLLVLASAPSLGCAFVTAEDTPSSQIHAMRRGLENARFRLRLDDAGRITALFDKRCRRELMSPGTKGNELRLHNDVMGDAWEVTQTVWREYQPLLGPVEMSVVERGPLRATIRVRHRFGRSKLVQDISVYSHTDRIDFRTEVDWHEENRMLRVSFPAPLNACHARCEIQFGHVLRPIHPNNEWERSMYEVPCQKWVDISEGDYGVALLNDCKYGYDVQNGALALSLLRATSHPDPTADRGRHTFTYSLLPHEGDFLSGGVVREAYALNTPLLSGKTRRKDVPGSWLTVDAPNVIIETIKPAEDGPDVLVRLYEAANRVTRCTLSGGFSRAIETDLMERPIRVGKRADGSLEVTLLPFEIKSLLLTPA